MILPAVKARVSVEAGTTFGWEIGVGLTGRESRHDQLRCLGPIERPAEAFQAYSGEHVLAAAKAQLAGVK